MVEAARFLAGHAAEPVAVSDAADHVGYSPFHLARSFEQHLGVPPGQFLTTHRFHLAKQLLLHSDDPVIDVCLAAGFASVGTFTTRFGAAVGSSPTAFRRLPHVLADSPPRPIQVPGGVPDGGVVCGSVSLSRAAAALIGEQVSVYVGLFRARAARGFPVSGMLLAEPGEFLLSEIPPGTYWLLSSALPARADPLAQLVPARSVVGRSPLPVQVTAATPWHSRRVELDAAPEWAAPVLVALPALASEASRSWIVRR